MPREIITAPAPPPDAGAGENADANEIRMQQQVAAMIIFVSGAGAWCVVYCRRVPADALALALIDEAIIIIIRTLCRTKLVNNIL